VPRKVQGEYGLTTAQFRMLQRIPDDGLDVPAIRQTRHHGINSQILTLRILVEMGLVIESRRDNYMLIQNN
jgi:hypothetical protein